ncbi:hypothetical protein [Actinomadura sp. 21ATH]|uniref:hypothetical protein n=1 Tax=Actinomadura sp. 21ATH TaxID=1735444 RepID=UPI0035C02E1E
MAPIKGDPALVEQLRFGVRQGDVKDLIGRAARCWDRYGLPDGSKNPGRQPGRLPDGMSGTLTPSEKDINDALNKLLRPVLDPADRWLLNIPRVLVPDRSSAHVLMSRKGAALAMPWSAFGGLFFVNALRSMLSFPVEHPACRSRRQRRKLARRLPLDLCAKATRYWLTGIKPPAECVRAVERLEHVITLWMKLTEPAVGQTIWAISVFEQALMTLHEFGHVVALGRDRPTGTKPKATHCTLADELGADQWSRRYARRLADGLFADPQHAIIPLLALYSTLDIAEMPDPGDPRRQDLAQRCALLIEYVTSRPIDLALVYDDFAKTRALYSRPERLLGDFRRLDDFVTVLAMGGIEADEEFRAFVDDLVERWT